MLSVRHEDRPAPTVLDTVVLVIGCGAAAALSVWLTWGVWKAGAPSGADTAAHLVRTDDALANLFNHGRLDGWEPSFGLGYQQFLFIGPGLTYAVALVKLLSWGTLSNLAAFKLVVVLCYVALPLSVAALASAFALGRRAAGVAAVLALAINSPYGGVGLNGVFGVGLVTSQLGSVLLCVTLAGVIWILREATFPRVVLTAVAAGALALTHGITAIIVVFLVVAVLVCAGAEWSRRHQSRLVELSAALSRRVSGAPEQLLLFSPTPSLLRRPRDALAALGVAVGAGLGLAGFALVPLVAHRNLRGFNTGFSEESTLSRLGEIWEGTFLVRPWVGPVLALAMVLWLRRARSGTRLAFTLVATPFVYLALAVLFKRLFPNSFISLELGGRAYAYLGVLAVLPLAAVLASASVAVTRWAGVARDRARNRSGPWTSVAAWAGAAAAVELAVLVVLVPAHLNRDVATTVRPTSAVVAAARELHRVVPEGGRFAMQRVPPNEPLITGLTHPDYWLAWASQRNTLNIYNVESSIVYGPTYEPEHLAESPAAVEAAKLTRWGVTHVLVLDEKGVPGLVRSPSFRAVWHRDSLLLLQVLAGPGQPDPASLLATPARSRAHLEHADSNHLVIGVDAVARGPASVAVGWSPKWQVAVNGRRVATSQTSEHLLTLYLPAGHSRVSLTFGTDVWDWLGRAVSLLTLDALLAVALHRRRNRRRRMPAGTLVS